MKVTSAPLKKSQIKLTIELAPEEFAKYEDKAALKLSEQVKIPGFRPGTAPKSVVVMHVGAEAIARQAIDLALPQTYADAIIQEKLPVATRPQVSILSETPLKYEATVALLPQVRVKDHKKIQIKQEETALAESDIDEVVKNLQGYYATHTPVQGPIEKGNRVEIDFEGTDLTGKEIAGTTSKNHPVIIGSCSLLPEFEKNLEGMTVGETKNFTITFPADYHAEHMRGKAVNFKTTVKSASKVDLPALTDDFIERVTGEKKTLAKLREEIHANLAEEKKQQSRIKQEDAFLEAVIEKTEVEISDMLIDEEVEYIMEEFEQDLKEKGLTLEQYLKGAKKTQQQLQESFGKEAEKRIKIRLALQFLFQAENIQVSPEEVDQELSEVAKAYPPSEQERVISEYKKNTQMLFRVKNRVMLRKLFDALLGAGN